MVWKMKKENNPTVPIQKYKETEIMRENFFKKTMDEVSRRYANNRSTKWRKNKKRAMQQPKK